jgi:large subunit ribosomal protein L14e
MIDIGRVCMKVAGRDAGKTCVVVDVVNDKFVTIDGQVKRKRCNARHLEPLKQTIDVKKGASHDEVKAAFKKLGIQIVEKKPKQKAERPKAVPLKEETGKAKPKKETKAAKIEKKEAKKK